MFENVPARFVPRDHPEPVYAHPDINYPRNADTLNAAYELLERGIERHGWGDRVAFEYVDEDRQITYRELLDDVERFATGLLELGVEPGDRVFWRFGDRPEAVVTQLATWKVGAVSIPSVLQERSHELQYFVNDVEPVVIVTEWAEFGEVEAVLDDCPTVEAVVVADADPGGPWRPFDELLEPSQPYDDYAETRPTDVASIYYSGGTSPGRSKGSIYSHASEAVSADVDAGLCRGYGEDDVIFEPAPIGHGRGNSFKTFPLRFGGRTVLTHRPDPAEVFGLIEDYGVTVFSMVPTFGRMMTATGDPDGYDLSSIRLLIFSGERLDEATYETWDDLVEPEPCMAVGGMPLRHLFFTSFLDGEKYVPGRAVKPAIGFDVKLVDLEDPTREVGRGEIGRLAVRGPVDSAYWNNLHPEMPGLMAADSIEFEWYLFDDAYSKDEDGYFRFESRVDDLIQSGGRNISGIEVEEVLIQHDLVDEVAVVGQPDELRGNVIKAVIVPPAGAETGEGAKEAIRAFAKEHMAPFKYPRQIEFVEDLPKNKAGKLRRSALVEE